MKQRKQAKLDYIRNSFHRIEQNSSSPDANVITSNMNSYNNSDSVLMIEATSIHGRGDETILPSSLLLTLANHDLLQDSHDERNEPLFFWLRVLRSGCVFPLSEAMMS